MSALVLPPRWAPLRPHPVQRAYWTSPHRFNVVPAGRRSGKTELFKRKLVRRALRGTQHFPARFFAAAPTREQAKRIYWDDLKTMIPPEFVLSVSETQLTIRTLLSEIWVLGMDKPERIEGSPWDGGGLDEYANMKPHAWGAHVRPALADRQGWCDLIGVPEGRNHYYDTYALARGQMAERGRESEWGAFTWKSVDILPVSEIEAARRDLDPLTFQQEYEASFVNFQGRAYYVFDEALHCQPLAERYDPAAPLLFAFDFNVSPGVAAVAQEMLLPNGQRGTGWIGEVFIPRNSNTPAVCRALIERWGGHPGRVLAYGDATGGARGTAQVEGSDWEIITREMRAVFGERFGLRVPTANPPERSRINAVNTRLRAGDGTVRMMVDPARCPHLVKDFEGVRLLEGGSGEIDKKADKRLTHISDAAGYYVHYEHPLESRDAQTFAFRI